ncbi:MAG: response regulator transcription factor [Chloroflexi bacterium]|nr:MAG: response regulator transcription factor [Chloroflexota bacterium]
MRILLCDDHRLFSEALTASLQSRGEEVVASVVEPQDAARLAVELDVDICLMDAHFPGGDSFAAVRQILDAAGDTRVVILSADDDRDMISTALACGATGFVLKRANIEVILEVMQRVHAGELVVRAGGAPAHGARQAGPGDPDALIEPLTAREQEVLAKLVLGQNTEIIALAMGIRTSTARTHIQNVMSKLGVHTKVGAVAFAVGNGLVPLCPPDLQDAIRAATRPQLEARPPSPQRTAVAASRVRTDRLGRRVPAQLRDRAAS